MKLKVGDRIYNAGDMANPSHFGTVSKVENDAYGTRYTIHPDYDPEAEAPWPYVISAASLSPVYKGHGGTRIVTVAAYREWRRQQEAAIRASMEAAQYDARRNAE